MINWSEIFRIETLIAMVFAGFLVNSIFKLIPRISKRIGYWMGTKFTKLDNEIHVRAAKRETWRAIYEISTTTIFTLVIILFGIYFNFNRDVNKVEYAIDAEYGVQVDYNEITEAYARAILFVGKTLKTSLHVVIYIFLFIMLWRFYSAYRSYYLITDFNWKMTRVKKNSSKKFRRKMEIKWAEMKSINDYKKIMKKLDDRLKP